MNLHKTRCVNNPKAVKELIIKSVNTKPHISNIKLKTVKKIKKFQNIVTKNKMYV